MSRSNNNNNTGNNDHDKFSVALCRAQFIPLFAACVHLLCAIIGIIVIGFIDINDIVLC